MGCAHGAARGGRASRDHPTHHGQDDQTQDVVENRRAEDDLALARLGDLQILQNTRRDADTGG